MTAKYVDLIYRGSLANPEAEAVRFENSALSFAEVAHLSNQLANVLIADGSSRGERLALLVNNGLYSVPLDFACVKAGINRVPLNARLSVQEHINMLDETSCFKMIYGADLAEHVAAIRMARPDIEYLPLGGSVEEGLLARAATDSGARPQVEAEDDDVILTLFTSGTTGTLKAAQHTQSSYAAICRNVLLNLINVQPGETMLHAASLIHASGVFVLPYWIRGGRTVVMSQFDPAAYLRLIREENVTAINVVPTMLQMLLAQPAFAAAGEGPLKQVIYGASPMPQPVIEQAMAVWGQHRFWQYYGQTECPLAVTVLRPEEHSGDALGTCGRVAPDVAIRLVDEAGRDVPEGEPGEIALRAAQQMTGYFNAPGLNDETFIEGGWLRTRDVGVFDSRGLLHVKDRTSDMIITGGYNVYPREVEDVLMAHPAVAECAVVGVRDDKWVEAVTAAVALKPGAAAAAEELVAFVSERIASYKKPQAVVFLDAIPKTAVGKINRKAVRTLLNKEQ